MSTNFRSRTLTCIGSLALLLGATGPAVQAAPARAGTAAAHTGSPASAAPGPFSDLPIKHPAYAACDTLTKMGFPFDRMGCYAPRTLTRYEFAVAFQRMHTAVRTAVRFVDGDSGPGPDFGEPKGVLKETFTDARKLRQALVLVDALGREFAPELQLLQTKPAELLSEVAAWHARADLLAEVTRNVTAPVQPNSNGR